MRGSRSGARSRGMCGLALGCLIVSLLSGPAEAFSLGYHLDLTREALSRRGFASGAIGQVQLANYLDDGFGAANSVVAQAPRLLGRKWGRLYGPAALRDASETYLHFGGFRDTDGATAAWDRLVRNTYRATRRAEESGDVAGLLTVLGASLHVVQDFYSHSNWSDLDWGGDATWFNVPASERAARDIYGYGRLNHTQLNKDEAGRPAFEKAYREAYYATAEWVWLVKSWVSPGLWDQAMTLADAGVKREVDYARYLSWYKGLWKGPGTDSSTLTALFGLAYLGKTDKTYINRWKRYCPLLTDAPSSGAVPLAGYQPMIGEVWLSVKTLEAAETGGGRFGKIDFLGDPDFYAIISVNGTAYVEAMYEDRKKINPVNWLTLVPLGGDYTLPTNRGRPGYRAAPPAPWLARPAWTQALTIEYALWDEDAVGGGTLPSFRGRDDLCDIVRDLKKRVWTSSDFPASYRSARLVETNGLRGSVSCFFNLFRSHGDGDEAKVKFTIGVSVPKRTLWDATAAPRTSSAAPAAAVPARPPTPAPGPATPSPTPPPVSLPTEKTAGTGDVRLVSIDKQAEVAVITNFDDHKVDLTGWTLTSVRGPQTFRFPSGFCLGPGETVSVVSGPKAPQSGNGQLRWTTAYVWENTKSDPGELRDGEGKLVSSWSD
jgi:hypothetical protein